MNLITCFILLFVISLLFLFFIYFEFFALLFCCWCAFFVDWCRYDHTWSAEQSYNFFLRLFSFCKPKEDLSDFTITDGSECCAIVTGNESLEDIKKCVEDRVFNPNLVHPFGYNQFKLIHNGGKDGSQKLKHLIKAKQFPSSSALLEACSDAISLPKSLVLGVLVEMPLLPRKN